MVTSTSSRFDSEDMNLIVRWVNSQVSVTTVGAHSPSSRPPCQERTWHRDPLPEQDVSPTAPPSAYLKHRTLLNCQHLRIKLRYRRAQTNTRRYPGLDPCCLYLCSQCRFVDPLRSVELLHACQPMSKSAAACRMLRFCY